MAGKGASVILFKKSLQICHFYGNISFSTLTDVSQFSHKNHVQINFQTVMVNLECDRNSFDLDRYCMNLLC